MNHSKLCIIFVIFLNVHIQGQKIGGGESVDISKYPFFTALLTNFGDGIFKQACGGTILTTNAILSAASCFYTDGVQHPFTWWRARVGSSSGDSGGTIYFINRITTHPDFSLTSRVADLAVVRTTFMLMFTPNQVAAAHLPGVAYTMSSNEEVWAIGWGIVPEQSESSSELTEVQFWVVDHGTCAYRYNEINFDLTEDMLCAGWLDVGVRGQCQSNIENNVGGGGGGGPLIQNGIVVGVYSWTQGCLTLRYPSVNTLIAPFSRWIVETALAA